MLAKSLHNGIFLLLNINPENVSCNMICEFEKPDMEQVLKIWLDASIKAHDFVKREFWESRLDDMRNLYLPAAENYVYYEAGEIKGFISLVDETIAAIFVAPTCQGCGIGKKLIAKAKKLRSFLMLNVYCKNKKSIDFYTNCGFKIVKKQTDECTGESEFLMTFKVK